MGFVKVIKNKAYFKRFQVNSEGADRELLITMPEKD